MNRLTIAAVVLKLLAFAASAFGENVCVGGCSGVTIGRLQDGREAVLTAAHCVGSSRTLKVAWYSGDVQADVLGVATAEGLDVALLAAHLPNPKYCNVLAESPVPVGTAVLGWGVPGCIPRCEWLQLTGRTTDERGRESGTNAIIVRLDAGKTWRGGMSGGPLKNGTTLIGIGTHRGTAANNTNAVYVQPAWLIRPWVIKTLGYLPECNPPQSPTPIQPDVAPPPPEVVVKPPVTPIPQPNAAALFAELEARINAKLEGLKGADGKDGRDGKDGKDFDPKYVVYFETEIDRLSAQMEALRAENEKLRGSLADKKTLAIGIAEWLPDRKLNYDIQPLKKGR